MQNAATATTTSTTSAIVVHDEDVNLLLASSPTDDSSSRHSSTADDSGYSKSSTPTEPSSTSSAPHQPGSVRYPSNENPFFKSGNKGARDPLGVTRKNPAHFSNKYKGFALHWNRSLTLQVASLEDFLGIHWPTLT